MNQGSNQGVQRQKENQKIQSIQIIQEGNDCVATNEMMSQKIKEKEVPHTILGVQKRDQAKKIEFFIDGDNQRSTLRIINEEEPSSFVSKQIATSSKQKADFFDTSINGALKQKSSRMNNLNQRNVNQKRNSQIRVQNLIQQTNEDTYRINDRSPSNRPLEQEYQQNLNVDKKQLFEELDEWTHEVQNIKRIQDNFTNQMLKVQSFKDKNENSQHISQKDLMKLSPRSSFLSQNQLQTSDSVNSKKNDLQYKDQEEHSYQTNELVQQMIEMSHVLKNQEEDQGIFSKASFTDKTMGKEPYVNVQILNSIMDHEPQQIFPRQKLFLSEQNTPTNGHMLSNGASPLMRRELRSKFNQNQDNDNSNKQHSSHFKSVSFKDGSNQSDNGNKITNEIKQPNQKIFQMPKKTIKQIQQETNEMLIEKLFIMKLRKKIEPLHEEQSQLLQKRQFSHSQSKYPPQNNQKFLQENNSVQTSFQVGSKNEEALNPKIGILKQQDYFIQPPNLKLQTNKLIRRPSSPQEEREQVNHGFLSHRDQNSTTEKYSQLHSNSKLKNKMIEKQQDIIREEIENFQNKTLESFKFIQEMKRTRTGTPQLMRLVGKQVGNVVDNNKKTERYLQQLEKEFSLQTVEKNMQISKQLVQSSSSNLVNERTKQTLLEEYKSTINRIKERKGQLEAYRLDTYRMQSVINSTQEEKRQMKEKLQDELEKVVMPKYNQFQLNSNRNIEHQQNQTGTKLKPKNPPQRSFAHLSSQIYETQENIKLNYENRQRSLSGQISNMRSEIQEKSELAISISNELQHLKNTKKTTKKQLKDYYLSLLKQNNSINDIPQISILALIEYMSEIGEEVTEKMLPSYLDEHNIALVKRFQDLSKKLEKCSEELSRVQKSTKSSLHSQIQRSKFQSDFNPIAPEIIPVRNNGNSTSNNNNQGSTKKNINENQINSQQILQQNINKQFTNALISSPAISASIISQQQLSNRNWEDEDRKLLQMMIGNELNHKEEIKKKLTNISKNTLRMKTPFSSVQYFNDDQLEDNPNQTYFNKNEISQDQQNINKKQLEGGNIQDESDDHYFFLHTLKRGSLSVLEYNTKLSEHIQAIQSQIQLLKEQELDRLIKKYNNISQEDRIQNVKKIFILMYGSSEGNSWFKRFLKRRNEIELKSRTNKTFNFSEVLYSKNLSEIQQLSTEKQLSQQNLLSKESTKKHQTMTQKKEDSKEQTNLEIELQNRQKMKDERQKTLRNFKKLQDEPKNLILNWTINDIVYQDNLKILQKNGLNNVQQKQRESLNEYKNYFETNNNHKQRKSVHFTVQENKEDGFKYPYQFNESKNQSNSNLSKLTEKNNLHSSSLNKFHKQHSSAQNLQQNNINEQY